MRGGFDPVCKIASTRSPAQKLLQRYIFNNRFHVAVRLFSNRSQMTSCGKDKKVAHEAIAECN